LKLTVEMFVWVGSAVDDVVVFFNNEITPDWTTIRLLIRWTTYNLKLDHIFEITPYI